jgi:hypothetical protein
MMVIPDILSSMAQLWLLKITEKTVQLIDDGTVIPAIPSSMAQMWPLKITEKTVQVIDDGNSIYTIQHGTAVSAQLQRKLAR